VAAGHVTAGVIEASFHVFRGNAERSQSCCQRTAKVVSSWPIFKPGRRGFAGYNLTIDGAKKGRWGIGGVSKSRFPNTL
jgi:hypothetical protein